MQGIYVLKGDMQHYAWGGEYFLPKLLNKPCRKGEHYAEWWLGSHPALPSHIVVDNNMLPLPDFIAEYPDVLGEESRKRFGETLPFLLKILDVATPLSIQLHPTKAQAEQGFSQENAQGIPLNAPKRTYKDRNHKPEMMLALSDFWLLHGFKTKEAIYATLQARPSLHPLLDLLGKESLKDFYAYIMQADHSTLSQWLLPIIEQNQQAFARHQLCLDNPDYWLMYSFQAMEMSLDKLDAGLLCFYLFNLVHLRKGEAIFQGAGIPHAYLRGQNIELMANSDNVIRGGLTPKYVNIPALLDVVDTQEITPHIQPASRQSVYTFPTSVEDFALVQMNLSHHQSQPRYGKNAEIFLLIKGTATLIAGNTTLHLTQGESAFICANTDYCIKSESGLFGVIATLP